VRLDGRLVPAGQHPPAAEVTALLDRLPDRTTATEAVLPSWPDGETSCRPPAAWAGVPGSAGCVVPARGRCARCAGGATPTKPDVVDDRFARACPPTSFAAWTQQWQTVGSPWRPHEVAAAEQLARHVGDVASRRAEEESQVAAALQRTLLLEQLPQVPGVALAARYLPSAADVVGGDWYDLVLLPNGRVAVVLGDVAGTDWALRPSPPAPARPAAFLLSSPGPAAALGRLNDLAAHLLPDELATAVVAELDPATGRLTVANAGHLPVLLLGGERPVLVDHGRGPALGMLSGAAYGAAELHLRGDDRLVLFSDGLVELRGPDLASACSSCSTWPPPRPGTPTPCWTCWSSGSRRPRPTT
jgi:hypothetical protein